MVDFTAINKGSQSEVDGLAYRCPHGAGFVQCVTVARDKATKPNK
jgi:hypothetical protein